MVSLAHIVSHELFDKVPNHHHHHNETEAHHHKGENESAIAQHEHSFLKIIEKITRGSKNLENSAIAQTKKIIEKHITSLDYTIRLTTHQACNAEQYWEYQIIPYNTITAVPTAPPRV